MRPSLSDESESEFVLKSAVFGFRTGRVEDRCGFGSWTRSSDGSSSSSMIVSKVSAFWSLVFSVYLPVAGSKLLISSLFWPMMMRSSLSEKLALIVSARVCETTRL
jgi:hypothetical protein